MSAWHTSGHLGHVVQKCTNPDGTPDLKKATLLLEVYALDIKMCAALRHFKRLKELYGKSLNIRSAIPHPVIMGTIRENGGKMHMREKAWELAHTDFFEAFKSYDDAGSPRRCVRRPATCCFLVLICSENSQVGSGNNNQHYARRRARFAGVEEL
jgi:hypothetical protein